MGTKLITRMRITSGLLATFFADVEQRCGPANIREIEVQKLAFKGLNHQPSRNKIVKFNQYVKILKLLLLKNGASWYLAVHYVVAAALSLPLGSQC